MGKLRESTEFKHFKRQMNDEVIHINSRTTFLRTFVFWTGAQCVEVAAVGLSLRSKAERNELRRIGRKLIDLADGGES